MRAFASTLQMIGAQIPRRKTSVRPGDAGGTAEGVVEIGAKGVPVAAVERLSRKLEIPPSALLAIIGVSERTAIRRRAEGFLKPDEADRLLRAARVVEEATRVFGSESRACRWLRTAHPLFENATPVELLDSDAGARLVSEELIRIDHGDFA